MEVAMNSAGDICEELILLMEHEHCSSLSFGRELQKNYAVNNLELGTGLLPRDILPPYDTIVF
jgi:hypothetical protein